MWSMDKVRELEKITPGKKPRPMIVVAAVQPLKV